ncbi:MAG: hypothetical protein ACYTAQ_14410, partial [Planctomycetota bacterium]
EDGTLDLILTTPIQPGPYLAGKLRGIFQFLIPLMLVPALTMLLLAAYVLADGFGRTGGVTVSEPLYTSTITLPVVLPEGAIALPLALAPFVAFCVMVGLHWSIRSSIPAGQNMPLIGAVITSFSPVNLLWAIVLPVSTVPKSLATNPASCRVALVAGALIAAVVYAIVVYAMHTTNKRSFMMTVRRLAGTT